MKIDWLVLNVKHFPAPIYVTVYVQLLDVAVIHNCRIKSITRTAIQIIQLPSGIVFKPGTRLVS